MAIPGLKPQYEVRGKVRIGEKRPTSAGKLRPAALDYFVSDDDELIDLFGEKPKAVRIVSPYEAAADFFSTGLEMWKGQLLACYSKGDGDPPIAYRRRTIRVKKGSSFEDVPFVTDADEVRGEPMGADRIPITCGFRECPIFKKRDCRPIGRLTFFLDGGRTDEVLQLDTKAWNSIERLQASITQTSIRRGTLLGAVFELSVAVVKKGRDQYPVLSIREADLQINNEADEATADVLIQLDKAVADQGADLRAFLAAALDHTNPGWRDNPAFIARIKEIGPREAAKGLLEKALA